MIGTTRQFVIAIVLASLVGILAAACVAAATRATASSPVTPPGPSRDAVRVGVV